MEIMVPVSMPVSAARPARQRLRDLRGARIALVDDNLDQTFTTHLQALLAEQHGASVERLVKPTGTAPSPKTLIDRAATAQVAIVGVAL